MSTLALTHEAISKALMENQPLTDDQRSALLGLVSRDKQAQDIEDRNAVDAARWRAVAHVFHLTDKVGQNTGQWATKLSTHWAAWVDGNHLSVTDAVDAYGRQRVA